MWLTHIFVLNKCFFALSPISFLNLQIQTHKTCVILKVFLVCSGRIWQRQCGLYGTIKRRKYNWWMLIAYLFCLRCQNKREWKALAMEIPNAIVCAQFWQNRVKCNETSRWYKRRQCSHAQAISLVRTDYFALLAVLVLSKTVKRLLADRISDEVSQSLCVQLKFNWQIKKLLLAWY